MAEPYLGEIKMFAGNFAPRSYALCDGQLIAISQNNALFSLLGTSYGGNGSTTFALPDLRGRLPVHQGHGPGLSPRSIGQKFGSEWVNLTLNQTPNHSHALQGDSTPATSATLNGNILADATSNDAFYSQTKTEPVTLTPGVVVNAGGSQSHTNLMPAQCIYFIISLYGTYPQRG